MAKRLVPEERAIVLDSDYWTDAVTHLEKAICDLQDEVKALRDMHMTHTHKEGKND